MYEKKRSIHSLAHAGIMNKSWSWCNPRYSYLWVVNVMELLSRTRTVALQIIILINCIDMDHDLHETEFDSKLNYNAIDWVYSFLHIATTMSQTRQRNGILRRCAKAHRDVQNAACAAEKNASNNSNKLWLAESTWSIDIHICVCGTYWLITRIHLNYISSNVSFGYSYEVLFQGLNTFWEK